MNALSVRVPNFGSQFSVRNPRSHFEKEKFSVLPSVSRYRKDISNHLEPEFFNNRTTLILLPYITVKTSRGVVLLRAPGYCITCEDNLFFRCIKRHFPYALVSGTRYTCSLLLHVDFVTI